MINAWPGIAFVVASEILLRMIRATGDLPSAEEAARPATEVGVTEPVGVPGTAADAVPGSVLV
jgi:hypothetical protein